MDRKPGFTLVESMIGVSLLLIIVTLVMVNASSMRSSFVRSEIDKLYTVCKFMQMTAQMTNKRQEIYIDLHHNSYTYGGNTEKLSGDVCFGILPDVKGPPSVPRTLLNSPITFDKQCISCTPHGIMNAGTIYLIDNQKKYLFALSSSVTQSSFIRKYAYENGWRLIR